MDINGVYEKFNSCEIENSSNTLDLLELTGFVKGVLAQLVDEQLVQIDPVRVTNAVSFLIDQVEAIQGAEKLFLMFRNGQRNESIKEILLGFNTRPEGFIANSILSSAFSEAAENGNIEIIDFIVAEFADRLDLDERDASEVVLVYINAGDEGTAIERLDLLQGENAYRELRMLQQYAYDADMRELAEMIRIRLEEAFDLEEAL